MTRAALPYRRPNATIAAEWQGHAITVTVGYDPQTGEPMEVFCDTAKGGDMAATLSDACVIISLALQHGVTPNALAKSLGRVPVWGSTDDAPASPIGVIVAACGGEVAGA